MKEFSRKVCEELKHYVYLYVDPRTDKPFYIGKGQNNRVFAHLKDKSDSEKVKRIEELEELGLTPKIEILKHSLTKEEALLVEATAIDLLDVDNLTNAVRGHGARHAQRAAAEEIALTLDADEVDIKEPSMLIVITNKQYHYGISPQRLYDATRSAWKVSKKREKAKLAMSVYGGIIREVYSIAKWVPGGATMRNDDKDGRHEDEPGRWEFVGKVAEESIRRRYVNKSVKHEFPPGAQNPIKYVNC